jgi:sec-independent protein translocase protein TatC
VVIPIVKDDPANPLPGSMWMNATTGFLKIAIGTGENRVLHFGSESVTTPIITLATYFDMVIGLLLAFGLAFQLPLVVLALVRIGIMEIATLKKMRRIVYFSLTVIAAVIVPDVVTGMIALMIPLILLYEFGILLASWGQKKEEAASS